MSGADLSVLALELQDRARRLEADRDDPRAITLGLQCRLLADDVSEYAAEKRRAEDYRKGA